MKLTGAARFKSQPVQKEKVRVPFKFGKHVAPSRRKR